MMNRSLAVIHQRKILVLTYCWLCFFGMQLRSSLIKAFKLPYQRHQAQVFSHVSTAPRDSIRSRKLTLSALHLPNNGLKSSRSALSRSSILRRIAFPSSLALLSTVSSSVITPTKPGPIEYFRKDYKPSPYTIPKLHLDFQLSPSETIVKATSFVEPQVTKDGFCADLVLDGDDIELVSISINGKEVSSNNLIKTATTLTVKAEAICEGPFTLETVVKLSPEKNLALSGLYKSGDLLCTQCEAMGFRRITYYLDRPDVLSKFSVRMEADKRLYPLLLSNGNRIDGGDLPEGRHWALWEDPFFKPSYLFALVAGDLASIHSEYITTSGRVVKLGIYSDKENGNKLDHAMYSLKESMKWDEDTFGLECDLDVYNIVATNDFNMGAMENKGLNIFNSAYVLANPKTATDIDYENILGVIAHEYFHNWTGNRVTVRDWFQLTLKEGLTVFRDQWFSSDATSHAVKRVEDVRGLRSRQFAEDQGPMAHPIRPDSYISMDNFYTSTVYSKGAEIIRIYRTLLGVDGFKAGLKEYFRRHDGSAVTCDDFRNAMADANNVDLSQLELWYSQAGTPIVSVKQLYDKEKQEYRITLSQRIPSTPGQPEESKKPMLIPVTIGLLSRSTGKELLPSTVLKLTQSQQEFVFSNIPEEPVASILRDFSAPVKLDVVQSDSDLALLMAHDTDSFNRWEAGNRLTTRMIFSIQKKLAAGETVNELPSLYIDAVRNILKSVLVQSSSQSIDYSLVSYALQLPDLSTLSQEMTVVDIDNLHAARKFVKKYIVESLEKEFKAVYDLSEPSSSQYIFSAKEVGRRRLHNTCLDFLMALRTNDVVNLASKQYQEANCMTDKIAALGCLLQSPSIEERNEALDSFHRDAEGDALVLNKWFSIQASADMQNLVEHVQQLKGHKDFILSNPNRARSLISAFANNLVHFHAKDGRGYKFVGDAILDLDKLNPQVAARMSSSFSQWKRYDVDRQTLMKEQLERIKSCVGVSKDTFEVASRCLL